MASGGFVLRQPAAPTGSLEGVLRDFEAASAVVSDDDILKFVQNNRAAGRRGTGYSQPDSRDHGHEAAATLERERSGRT